MLCLLGLDGYFKAVNPTWTRTLGYSRDELMARPYAEFVHPDDRAATETEAGKLAMGFQIIHFRNRYICRDGTYKWLSWTASAATDEGLIYAGARDITSTVFAEEEEVRFLRQQLERIQVALNTKAFKVVFQPIVDFRTQEVIGLEALARFGARPWRPPNEWFADAGEVGLRPELEMRAIREAIAFSKRLPEGVFLSVNASPETLLTKAFNAATEEFDGNRLVVEVTEHAAVDDYNALQRSVAQLRNRGVRLAIDDAGAGFASLKHIVRLVPEFIKLDNFLTRGIDSDPVKRALAAAMVSFAAEIGARLIAEGVETKGELRALAELGFEEAQGYYLGMPEKTPRRRINGFGARA
jgi:PAS domain S-box-containing protein